MLTNFSKGIKLTNLVTSHLTLENKFLCVIYVNYAHYF